MKTSGTRNSKQSPAVVSGSQKPFTVASAAKAILAVAKQHDLTVHIKGLSFTATGRFTIAHAPVVGLERYTANDFAKGAAIELITVNSRVASKLPNGTYLVRAQFRPRATKGIVSFVAANGRVVAQGNLIVRTRKQASNVFPDVYPGPISEIPVITSTHVWIGNQAHVGEANYGHWGVDCTGWDPIRTLYFWS